MAQRRQAIAQVRHADGPLAGREVGAVGDGGEVLLQRRQPGAQPAVAVVGRAQIVERLGDGARVRLADGVDQAGEAGAGRVADGGEPRVRVKARRVGAAAPERVAQAQHAVGEREVQRRQPGGAGVGEGVPGLGVPGEPALLVQAQGALQRRDPVGVDLGGQDAVGGGAVEQAADGGPSGGFGPAQGAGLVERGRPGVCGGRGDAGP